MSQSDIELLSEGAFDLQRAAEFTGVSARRLQEARKRKELKTFKLGTRVLWPKRGLVLWLASGGAGDSY
jgi:hypothetical protein